MEGQRDVRLLAPRAPREALLCPNADSLSGRRAGCVPALSGFLVTVKALERGPHAPFAD